MVRSPLRLYAGHFSVLDDLPGVSFRLHLLERAVYSPDELQKGLRFVLPRSPRLRCVAQLTLAIEFVTNRKVESDRRKMTGSKFNDPPAAATGTMATCWAASVTSRSMYGCVGAPAAVESVSAGKGTYTRPRPRRVASAVRRLMRAEICLGRRSGPRPPAAVRATDTSSVVRGAGLRRRTPTPRKVDAEHMSARYFGAKRVSSAEAQLARVGSGATTSAMR